MKTLGCVPGVWGWVVSPAMLLYAGWAVPSLTPMSMILVAVAAVLLVAAVIIALVARFGR